MRGLDYFICLAKLKYYYLDLPPENSSQKVPLLGHEFDATVCRVVIITYLILN